MTVTLINIFEVPHGADEEFVRWWGRTAAFIEERIGAVPAALHRSIDADARFRYVNVATIADPSAWRAAVAARGFPGGEQPGTRHPGLFELIRGPGNRPGPGAITIAPFDRGDEEGVLAAWDRAPGERLYRALGAGADFPCVELSAPERRSGPARTGDGCHPALYEVVAR